MQQPEIELPEDDLPITLAQREAEFEAQVLRAILTGHEFPPMPLPS